MGKRGRAAQMLKEPRLTVWFCSLCIIFGLPFVFLYPPFLASDEVAHFYRAYQVSEFRFASEARGREGGGMLPSSLSGSVGAVRENMLDVPGFTLKLMSDIQRFPLDPHERVWTVFTGAALYSPLPYLPQSSGIFIGRMLSLTPLTLHYIARICSLLAWLLMGMYALRIIPFYKNVLFMLLLTPLVFSKAAVVTADVVTVGACTLLVCQVLKMAYGTNGANRTDVMLMFGLAALVGLCKIVYAPFAVLCFLIPPERFGGKKRFWLICGGTVFIALAANLLWTGFLAANIPLQAGVSAQPRTQVMYMLRRPFDFARIVYRYTYDNLWINFQAMFGSVIVWREVNLPLWVITSLWAAVLLAAFADKQAAVIRLWKKAGVLALVLIIYVLIIASLYVTVTVPMSNRVHGMQPRYMFPLLLPLLLIIKRGKAGKHNMSVICILMTTVSLCATIAAMFTRFM